MKSLTLAVILITSISLKAQVCHTIGPPKKVPVNSTYCNPINIEYCFRPGGKTGREAADPLIVPFKNDYYLFASKSAGYWWSPDLLNWKLVPSNDNYQYRNDEHQLNGQPEKDLPVWGYNPAASVVNGSLIYSQQLDAFYQLSDPKKGTFERVRDKLEISNDEWLFSDDDGRVYLYSVGFKPVRGIYVYELDSKDHLKVLQGPIPCRPKGDLQQENEGDFSILPNRQGLVMPIGNKSGEGPQMTKRNGRYFLQVSFSGTEDPRYRDCAFVSDSPTGPFEYCKNNPVSYRPAGFTTGAGNSGLFADHQNRDWRVVTTCLSALTGFERRISMYPAGVDQDGGLYTDTYLGDLPQYGPGNRKPGLGGNLVGWMLLSYKKVGTSSSVMDHHPIEAAFDENIKTWWSAKTGDAGEWLAVDLGKICRINAIQVNFAEQNTTASKRRIEDELYHQYTIEISADGKKWKMAADKSANQKDVPHDYIQLKKPVIARYLRIKNIHMPANGEFAVRDFRIFGSGLGKLPEEVKRPIVKQHPKENARSALAFAIEWPAAEGATGYAVRWGIAKDKLYHSQDTRDNKTLISDLTSGLDYFFVIDSFNENGVTFGSKVVSIR
jgi:hypothetical protein